MAGWSGVRWGDTATLETSVAAPLVVSGDLISVPSIPEVTSPRVWCVSVVVVPIVRPVTPPPLWIEVYAGTGSAVATWREPVPIPLAAARTLVIPDLAAQQLRARLILDASAAPVAASLQATVSLAPYAPPAQTELPL